MNQHRSVYHLTTKNQCLLCNHFFNWCDISIINVFWNVIKYFTQSSSVPVIQVFHTIINVKLWDNLNRAVGVVVGVGVGVGHNPSSVITIAPVGVP